MKRRSPSRGMPVSGSKVWGRRRQYLPYPGPPDADDDPQGRESHAWLGPNAEWSLLTGRFLVRGRAGELQARLRKPATDELTPSPVSATSRGSRYIAGIRNKLRRPLLSAEGGGERGPCLHVRRFARRRRDPAVRQGGRGPPPRAPAAHAHFARLAGLHLLHGLLRLPDLLDRRRHLRPYPWGR